MINFLVHAKKIGVFFHQQWQIRDGRNFQGTFFSACCKGRIKFIWSWRLRFLQNSKPFGFGYSSKFSNCTSKYNKSICVFGQCNRIKTYFIEYLTMTPNGETTFFNLWLLFFNSLLKKYSCQIQSPRGIFMEKGIKSLLEGAEYFVFSSVRSVGLQLHALKEQGSEMHYRNRVHTSPCL